MKNILVPIGINPNSLNTLQYAIDFAAEFSSKIHIIDVFAVTTMAGTKGSIEKKVEENSRERLQDIVDKVDTKSVTINIAGYKGTFADGIKDIDKKIGIDLIIIAARSNDVKEELYLGRTSGKIIKQTNIPTLIVPKGTTLQPMRTFLTAFRSGILKRKRILNPLIEMQKKFDAKVNLLLIKTPGYTDDDLKINTALMDISSNVTIAESQTTYLGVLEHFQSQKPDLLVIFRRKRGFFKKLWEKSEILKSEFTSSIPVLVLSVKKD